MQDLHLRVLFPEFLPQRTAYILVAEAALKAILQSNPELLIKVAQSIQNCSSVEAPISKDFSLSKYRISKSPSPKAKISANISENPANEKGPNQSKCLLTIQLLLASTKPANACGVRACGTPGVTRTRYIPLRSRPDTTSGSGI